MPPHLATLTVGTIALVIGLLGRSQKRRADNKSEWWRRTQFSIQLIVSAEKEDIIAGTAMLAHLGREDEKRRFFLPGKTFISDPDDRKLMRVIALGLLSQGVEPERTLGEEGSASDGRSGNVR